MQPNCAMLMRVMCTSGNASYGNVRIRSHRGRDDVLQISKNANSRHRMRSTTVIANDCQGHDQCKAATEPGSRKSGSDMRTSDARKPVCAPPLPPPTRCTPHTRSTRPVISWFIRPWLRGHVHTWMADWSMLARARADGGLDEGKEALFAYKSTVSL